ncbi:MAG: hypothetical protein ACRCUJ_04195 [Phocaeicola sp.]
MLIAENNTYKIDAVIVAAFCYQGITTRKLFVKVSATHYRLLNSSKIVNYRSLYTLGKALKNEKV